MERSKGLAQKSHVRVAARSRFGTAATTVLACAARWLGSRRLRVVLVVAAIAF